MVGDLINDLHEKNKGGKFTKALGDISLWQMHALSDYEETGVDCKVIIGDEDELRDLVRNTHLPGAPFTTFGKLTEKRLAKFLQAFKKEYRLEVQIFFMRRVR